MINIPPNRKSCHFCGEHLTGDSGTWQKVGGTGSSERYCTKLCWLRECRELSKKKVIEAQKKKEQTKLQSFGRLTPTIKNW